MIGDRIDDDKGQVGQKILQSQGNSGSKNQFCFFSAKANGFEADVKVFLESRMIFSFFPNCFQNKKRIMPAGDEPAKGIIRSSVLYEIATIL